MSMSDCEKCWDTPCTCGHGYKEWSVEALERHIKMLKAALTEASNKCPDCRCPDGHLAGCQTLVRKEQTKELYNYLVKVGWAEHISEEVSKAYIKNGIQGIVKASEWMNDTSEHDYTHGITMDIASWYLKNFK